MNLVEIDAAIVTALAEARSSPFTELFSLFTNAGGEAAVATATLVAALLLWHAQAKEWAFGLLLSVGGAVGGGYAMKEVVGRMRPDEMLRAVLETGYSFPSLHAAAAMALYGFFLWMLLTRTPGRSGRAVLAALLIFVILVIGGSRVYLGVHYPSDVLGGFALGAVFVWLGVAIARRLAKAR